MAKTKISEFNANPALNTDIDSINLAEGCAPSGINDAIRELMSQLKDWQSGTSNDPMVIGSSGSLTLNQGTANGVAYLNGSKVVTSGSALTFDGTNLGVGVTATKLIEAKSTTTNLARIRVNGTGTTAGNYRGYEFSNGSTFKGGFLQDESTDAISVFTPIGGISYTLNNDGTSIWAVSSSEAMRLTSTGLGIGTSSPSQKLTVAAASPTIRLSDTTTSVVGGVFGTIDWQSADGSMSGGLAAKIDVFDDGGAYGDRGALRFFTNNATSLGERMRLDSSGNLGLGVTPSAWSTSKAIQVGSTAALFSYNNTTTDVGSNVYYDGASYKYITTNSASFARQTSGGHSWYTAASGTAGNAITFTQAMSLLSSGAWVLGDTSVVASGFAGVKFNGASFNGLGLNDSSSTSGVGFIYFQSNGTTIGTITRVGATSAVAYNTSSDYRLKNITGPVTTSGSYIDSLNPVEGTWKADGSTFVGLIAHEVQEASRTQVATGTKDGAEMQAMDYSSAELIANLIAEVKSLRKRLANAGL